MKTLLSSAAVALVALSSAAFAQDITITDPYARSSSMMAKAGAAFMTIANAADADDTLIGAQSDVAEKVELHTHIADENGVMKMRQVEGGIPVPAHGEAVLQRGGLHVMFLGITDPFEQGEMLDVTLVFENAGEIAVQIPVDLERKPMHGKMDHGQGHGKMDHSHDHGKMDHSKTESN